MGKFIRKSGFFRSASVSGFATARVIIGRVLEERALFQKAEKTVVQVFIHR